MSDDLKSERGVTDQSSLKQIFDYGFGVGGPFKQDKLWFYATIAVVGRTDYGASSYFDSVHQPVHLHAGSGPTRVSPHSSTWTAHFA